MVWRQEMLVLTAGAAKATTPVEVSTLNNSQTLQEAVQAVICAVWLLVLLLVNW